MFFLCDCTPQLRKTQLTIQDTPQGMIRRWDENANEKGIWRDRLIEAWGFNRRGTYVLILLYYFK